MAVFVDTGIFSGAYNLRDKYHERAGKLLGDALTGKYGIAYTTDYVFDEAVTLTLYRTGKAELAIELGEAILRSPRVRVINVTDDLFKGAW
ncbi:MAG: type II toxin-antitoxin system VapC family toxin, partial [Candidatus Bathyarchaeia archaeon]